MFLSLKRSRTNLRPSTVERMYHTVLPSGASGLKGKFSNRRLPFMIRKERAKQGSENLEQGSQVSTMRVQIVRQPMTELLGMGHEGQHGKGGFNDHAFVPSPFLADFQVRGHTLGVSKTQVGQDNRLLGPIGRRSLKSLSGWLRGNQYHATPGPASSSTQHRRMPMLQRPLSLPFLPICCGLRPARMGKSSSMG